MIKLLVFLLIVFIIPFLIGVVVSVVTDDSDAGTGCALVFTVILFFVWFLGNTIVGENIKTESYVSGTYHLSSLTKNNYIQSTQSKSSVTNSTVERYDYYINNNGEFRSYWVNADEASLKLKDGALDLEIIKEHYTPNFMTKYVVPETFFVSDKAKYTFYADPQYAKENLGIQVGK